MKTIHHHNSTVILSPQKGGFLSTGPYVFTHTLNPYIGCGFGTGSCGAYCYAPSLPSWSHGLGLSGAEWGKEIVVKENAPELLEQQLRKMTPEKRNGLRIFMSSGTDPYQPIEANYRITEHLLRVFAKYDDLGLLVIQTRSPLAERDLELMATIPYLWLSVTIETDDQEFLSKIKPGSPALTARRKLVDEAMSYCIKTQIVVSPCLPHTDGFVDFLLCEEDRPDRIVVDTLVAGDGARGERTARSPLAKIAEKLGWNWRDETAAQKLYTDLRETVLGNRVGWSSVGFCSIPSQPLPLKQLTLW